MNIIDTNGVDYILRNEIMFENDYFLVPDVVEEVEMTQLIHDRQLPREILKIAQHALFDEATYLHHYNKILNKYGGRSFYNMTGFGDVSIIASLHMLISVFEAQYATQLFDPTEQILVFTNDAGLISKIATEFSGRDIHTNSVTEIK